MEAQVHADAVAFWELAGPLFTADPVRHTLGLSVIRRVLEAPDPADLPPVMVTLHDGGALVGAAFRTPPWPMIASAVPPKAAQALAKAWVAVDPELPGVNGPRDCAEPLAAAFAAELHIQPHEDTAIRLYRLQELSVPDVPGNARGVTENDIEFLAEWRKAAVAEMHVGNVRNDRHDVEIRRAMALGNGFRLWQDGGTAVSWAGVIKPIDGMSRIGPVYTPLEFRKRGYGSAVTAAAAQWALANGADKVLLFTDLANPTSNSIYQKIGFRPVLDAVELKFTRPPHHG